MKRMIKKCAFLATACCLSLAVTLSAKAAGGGGYVLDTVHVNMSDKASLQRGAALFVNYCLSCHGAEYARYNRVAEDLEIPLWQLKENLMFTTDKEGDLMKTTMSAEDAAQWFGVAPPDLSLVSRVRKPDWVYTYLRAFYQDENSPSGWNNSLFENVAMPHVMFELQGAQRLVRKVEKNEQGPMDANAAVPAASSVELEEGQVLVGDAIFELAHEGSMTPAQFDTAMTDLTAFLVYLSEPAVMKRKTIGVYTLSFLIILLLLCYYLKKEYWRDVH